MYSSRELVLAYAAGIIDGEGHIGINVRNKKTADRDIYHESRIELSNTDEVMIDFFVRNFGGSKTQKLRPNRKKFFKWQIAAANGERFIKEIYPYLVCKQDQADIYLEFRSTFVPQGHPIKEETFQKRASCHKRMIALRKHAYA